MAVSDDNTYAQVLICILQDDFSKTDSNPKWRSVALWMAEEVRVQAGKLRLPLETSREMTELADSVKRALRESGQHRMSA